jgi:hypothetical protein
MSNPWEAIARSAVWIRDEIEGPFAHLGIFRDPEVLGELSVILDHLVCCRSDDLPARAVTALVDAWLTAARGHDPLFGDDDDVAGA